MTAEEYLEMMKFKGHVYDLVTMANAEVAVELVRKEKQEKDIDVFKALCSKRLIDEIEKAISTPDNLSANRFVKYIIKQRKIWT